MNKTKIDYADYTWNPVWGCRNTCEYCYARATAKRWGASFEPNWREKNFNRPMPKKPSIIFVNSMSDICWWENEWLIKVFDRIDTAEAYKHIFLFLTKKPEIYTTPQWLVAPDNVWRGFTATNDEEMIERQAQMYGHYRVWCSAEPLLGPIESVDTKLVKWLVVGAMTGPGAVEPRREWINSIMGFQGRLFLKRNLPAWALEYGGIDKYPQEMLKHLGRLEHDG